MMQTITIAATVSALAAAMAVAGGASAQPAGAQVRVEHAAARLVVIAEPRNTVSVTVHQGSSRLPPLAVRQEGGGVIVDGGLDAGPRGPFGRGPVEWGGGVRCVGSSIVTHVFGSVEHTRDTRGVLVRGVGRVDLGDLPVITARVPLNARIATDTAVWGEIGPTESLALSASGCGDWRLGDVRGTLNADLQGSGDAQGGAAGTVHGRLAGSGDLALRQVAGPADLMLAGSGDVKLGPVGGPLRASLSGSGDIGVASVVAPVEVSIASSGDVRIHGGHAPELRVKIAGSGDFAFDGVADSLSAAIVGSGDISVAHVTGPVSKSVVGSGEVNAGR